MKNKITAIIQVRMGSTRLPGKALLPLARKPVLWWLINRVLHSKYINDVIIATTDDPANKPINDFYDQYFKNADNVNVFNYSGNEDDVLDRVLVAAKENDTKIIVDLTGDCPMVDPIHIDFLCEELLNSNCGLDYVSNCIYRSWPDGFDIQVYYTKALEECKQIFSPKHHVGINIGHNPEYFAVFNWFAPGPMYYPDLGLTLDTKEDYGLLQIIFNEFGSDIFFKVEDVIYWLNKNPELLKINSNIKRKEIWEG